MESQTSRRGQHAGTRLLAGTLVLAFLLLWAGWLTLNLLAAQPLLAQEDKAGVVVVQFDDHGQVVRPIKFAGSISGIEALTLSELEVVTASTNFGPAVCSIAGVGCPSTDCFCNAAKFWSYSYWDGNTWQGYLTGASTSVVSQTGAVEGWRWGEFGAAQTPATVATAAVDALGWLAAGQVITDGGYGSAGATVETLLAAGANDIMASDWRRIPGSASLADDIVAKGAAFSRTGAAAAGKLAVALAAADACLPAGVRTPAAYYSPTLGAYSAQSGPNAFAILGALAISEPVPAAAIPVLMGQVQASGGWEWAPGWGADTNATALAIQALVAGGEPVTASTVVSGVAFLKAAQNADGGFPYAPPTDTTAPSDVNSTAYVVQALIAADEDPAGIAWTVNGATAISYLLSMQLAGGSFEWQPGTGSNQLATQQAIPALLGRAYPIRRAELAACPTLFLPALRR